LRAHDLLGADLLAVRLDAGGALVFEIPAARNLDLLALLKNEVTAGELSLRPPRHRWDSVMAVVYHLFRRARPSRLPSAP